MDPGGLPQSYNRATEGIDVILERWDKNKQEKQPSKKKRIYQLGQSIPLTKKEERAEHLTL